MKPFFVLGAKIRTAADACDPLSSHGGVSDLVASILKVLVMALTAIAQENNLDAGALYQQYSEGKMGSERKLVKYILWRMEEEGRSETVQEFSIWRMPLGKPSTVWCEDLGLVDGGFFIVISHSGESLRSCMDTAA